MIVIATTVVITGVMVGSFGYMSSANRATFQLTTAILWALFAVTVVVLRGVPTRVAVIIIVAGSVAVSGAALLGPPDTSTDAARYSWDGIVQDAGISPYKFTPRDDALATLRPDWLFSTPTTGATGPQCSLPRRYLTRTTPSGALICTAINRPTVPTIYPPAGEIFFAAVRAAVPRQAQYWPFQVAGLLMTLAVTFLLIVGLKRRGLNPRWSAFWALSPITVSEAVANSHIDVLGSLLTVLAIFAIAQGVRWRGGVLLGAAIATKLIPILAAPAVLRREPWKVIIAAVATFVVLYIPYVATTGVAVIGYLPGYLSEGGYDNGSRFVLLRAFLPPTAAIVVAAVLFLTVVVLTMVMSNPDRPWLGQLVVIGAALVIASPPYAWYSLLILPFIAMAGRWEWMAVPLALSLHTFAPSTSTFRWSLLLATAVVVAGSVIRLRSTRMDRPRVR